MGLDCLDEVIDDSESSELLKSVKNSYEELSKIIESIISDDKDS